MNQVSDGQRRRVQIVLGLMEPWEMLLLDEVTVDLDVLVRQDLLTFLKRETEERNATIVYATHIFDGLGSWPTHVAHISDGEIDFVRDITKGFPELDKVLSTRADKDTALLYNSPLLLVVEQWLRDDNKKIKAKKAPADVKVQTKWEVLSENMKEYGDKYYDYWKK